MKKVVIFLVILFAVLLGFQLYSMNLIKKFSQDLNASKSENFTLLKTNTTSSLFSSKSENIIRLYDIDFKVVSNTSHVLGFVRSSGQIEILTQPLASIAKVAFDDKNITFEQSDDALKLKIPPFYFENEGEKFSANESQISLKNDFTKGFNFSQISVKNDYLNFESFSQNASLKGLNLDFKRSEQKDKLALNISSFDSGFMGLFGFSGDEVFLNFDSNNGNGKLGLKIAKLKLANDEIQSILLDLNFLDLNQNALFSQNFYEILKANSKIKLKNVSFNAGGGAFKANLTLNINEKYDQNLENIMNFSTFSGELSASRPLTKMLPNLALMISAIELTGTSQGILIKDGDGYKTSFKSISNDILFNEQISLKQVMLNEFLNLLN